MYSKTFLHAASTKTLLCQDGDGKIDIEEFRQLFNKKWKVMKNILFSKDKSVLLVFLRSLFVWFKNENMVFTAKCWTGPRKYETEIYSKMCTTFSISKYQMTQYTQQTWFIHRLIINEKRATQHYKTQIWRGSKLNNHFWLISTLITLGVV